MTSFQPQGWRSATPTPTGLPGTPPPSAAGGQKEARHMRKGIWEEGRAHELYLNKKGLKYYVKKPWVTVRKE